MAVSDEEDGIGPLPLPQHLQRIVDLAPASRLELDAYFNAAVDENWSDPILRASARYVYDDEQTSCPPIGGIPNDVLTEVDYFAAEMRVKRDKTV